MVQVREQYDITASGEVDTQVWVGRLLEAARLPESAREPLLEVATQAKEAEVQAIASDNIWSEHTSGFLTGLEMADILADLQLDQDALIASLESGQLFAAGLDVCTPEPLPNDHRLLALSNCQLIPHIGSATVEARNAMAERAATNILSGIRG